MRRRLSLSLLAGAAALTAAPAMAQVTLATGDARIDGSLCVGFDCPTSISFGFDTIRLMENNLRVHFQDTSTSASFPTTDWEITINDSSNGGDSYFAVTNKTNSRVPLRLHDGAPTNSLVVDDQGDVGIGVASAVVELHVADGDSPTLRLEQNGSSGFTPQTWDLAGNETNFFVRDVTNGSKLPLRVRPSAPTSSIDIAADGDVGMGTSSPASSLDITRTTDVDVGVRLSRTAGANQVTWLFENDAGSGNFVVEVEGGNKPFKVSSTAVQNLLRVGLTANNEVDINGTLVTNGSCSVGCDRVFADDYPLLSIDQQVEQMWANSYLPNIGPTPEQGRYDVTDKMLRMLSELEKAHIYIGQLHQRIETLEEHISDG
ncbi:MAG: hypothetical protein ACWA47_06380 [Brevirhabdus sp.]